jgi:4'-phosphopantetheinyl transferase
LRAGLEAALMVRATEDSVSVSYCLTDELGPADLARLQALLSRDERARSRRFHFEHDRRDFVAAHGLLRQALSRAADVPAESWRFQADVYGKPALVDDQAGTPPLAFNLTHARGIVGCVVACAAAVGIDAEIVRPAVATPEMAARCFVGEELRLLERATADAYAVTFAELWTLKEAYIKAVGAGLSLALDSFCFSFEGVDRLSVAGVPDADMWEFLLAAPSPDSRLAVAVQAPYRERQSNFSFHDMTPSPTYTLRVRRSSHPHLLE